MQVLRRATVSLVRLARLVLLRLNNSTPFDVFYLAEWLWKKQRVFSRKSGARTSTEPTSLLPSEWSRICKTWLITTSQMFWGKVPTIITMICQQWRGTFRQTTGSPRTIRWTIIWISSRSSPACVTISRRSRRLTACQALKNQIFWETRICHRMPQAVSICIPISCQTLKK